MFTAILGFLFSTLSYEGGKMEILKKEDARIIHLMDGIHLYDDKLDITGKEAWFAQAQGSLIVKDSLVIKAPDEVTIVGDSLYFDTEERTSYIFRRVVATRGSTRISGPRLTIDHRKREAYIPFGARIHDSKENILILGEEVTYNLNEDRGSIMKRPVFSSDEENSGFKVTGERMHIDKKQKVASAASNVRIDTDDADVYTDSLELYYNADKGHAFGNTYIISPDGRIQADSADFWTSGRELEEVFLYPEVETRHVTEGTDSVVVKSTNLTIDMKQKNKEVMIFTGNVYGKYFWNEESEDGKD
ncbi:hypothetical protein GF359_06285 [candidate division WOR-3 bacterium]|uniref:Organic solvent tolerance-like N-terminal domain-containing protein n=1 Tax=candidate division WOR-3 bacterium TaxID=2052148 RepID=A0A9D5K9D6_UNCW3|nr:hypothetical protein [candidate division WOR-3 bacterium]MBD3364807.1 hypothetical protein [candidate division WOR-3 bacterium]